MQQKKIGFWALLSLSMGNMIGAGIFMLPSSLATYGSLSLAGWGITTLGALFLALVFSQLSSRFPNQAGGPYTYCRLGLGSFMGFQIGWLYWVSMWVGSAATITASIGYLSVFFPVLSIDPWYAFGTSTAVIWMLTFLNIRVGKTIQILQIVMTILRIAPLIILVLMGIPLIKGQNFLPVNPSNVGSFQAILSSSILTMWTFVGIESATVPTNQVKNPGKTVARATLWGTLLVALFYILISIFIIGIIPNCNLQGSTSPFALAASIVFGPWGETLMAAVAVVASLGCLSGWFIIQSYVPMVAAQDGLFPKKFSTVNKEGKPIFSLLITGLLINLLIGLQYNKGLVSAFNFLILLATASVLLIYFFSIIAEGALFFKSPKQFSGKALIKQGIILILAMAYSLFCFAGASFDAILWILGIFILGIPIYWMKSRFAGR